MIKLMKRRPIFLQFLDCVHQLILQFPNSFEFNEEMLLFLARNYNTNLFGTFLFDKEKDRVEKNAKKNTCSVWTDILMHKEKYLNVLYEEDSQRILTPNYAFYKLKFWERFFLENSRFVNRNCFYISDLDKDVVFYDKIMFYNYMKKQEELKLINKKCKYDNLVKIGANVFQLIKDNKEIWEKLSEKSKKTFNDIINLDLEDYIIGVVAAEMPALYEYEALKAFISKSFGISRISPSSL